MKIITLEQLYIEELRDLYSAETQLIKALPGIIDAVESQDFKDSLTEHLEETKYHKDRLMTIFIGLQTKPDGNICEATEGLLKESKEIISEIPAGWLRDSALTGSCLRIEYYEQAAYLSAIRLAEALDYPDQSEILAETLAEEMNAGEIISEMGDMLLEGPYSEQVDLEWDEMNFLTSRMG